MWLHGRKSGTDTLRECDLGHDLAAPRGTCRHDALLLKPEIRTISDQACIADSRSPGCQFPAKVCECKQDEPGLARPDGICQGRCADIGPWRDQIRVIQNIDQVCTVCDAILGRGI